MQLSQKMLLLARSMLEAVKTCSTAGKRQLSARIGVGVDKVVVGALGSWQPRVHIRGAAVRRAEMLEQQVSPGLVNVCGGVLDMLQ